MKNNSSLAFFIVLFSILQFNANAQQQQAQPSSTHIGFTYDAAGNRVKREYFANRIMNDTAKNDPKAQQIAQQHGISVYPNPTEEGNIVNVVISSKVDTKENETATVTLLDNTGKMLFTQQQSASSLSQIDLNKYTSGVYYVKVMIGKEQLFYRVVKAK